MDGGEREVLSDSLPRTRADANGLVAGGRSTEGRNPSEDCSWYSRQGSRPRASPRRPHSMEQRLTMCRHLEELRNRIVVLATSLCAVALAVLATPARAQQPAAAAEDGQ